MLLFTLLPLPFCFCPKRQDLPVLWGPTHAWLLAGEEPWSHLRWPWPAPQWSALTASPGCTAWTHSQALCPQSSAFLCLSSEIFRASTAHRFPSPASFHQHVVPSPDPPPYTFLTFSLPPYLQPWAPRLPGDATHAGLSV